MRALPARRLASTALCAVLLAGVTGPTAVAAAPAPGRAHAPVPGADTLLARTRSLGDLGTVLKPVTDLLTAVLTADNGQLPPDRATRLAAAAKTAITHLTAPPPASPAGPAGPASSVLPSASVVAQAKGRGDVPVAKDLAGDALVALRSAIDGLAKAVSSGDAGRVGPAVTAVLTGVVDHLAALLLGGGLPAPHLAGLSVLPVLRASTPIALPEG